jgi:hypothetical protein
VCPILRHKHVPEVQAEGRLCSLCKSNNFFRTNSFNGRAAPEAQWLRATPYPLGMAVSLIFSTRARKCAC